MLIKIFPEGHKEQAIELSKENGFKSLTLDFGNDKAYSHLYSMSSIDIKEVVENITKYLNLNNTEVQNKENNSYTIESYIGKNTLDVKTRLNELGMNPIILGDGDKVIGQYPSTNTCVLNSNKVILLTNSKEKNMPNLIGLSKKDAINVLDLLKVPYTIEGTGFVVGQEIPENTLITLETKQHLILQNKYNLEEVN